MVILHTRKLLETPEYPDVRIGQTMSQYYYENTSSFYFTEILKGFWNLQGSLDHISKIAVLLVPIGNAKIFFLQHFAYPPRKKKLQTHRYTQKCTNPPPRTHTHIHTITTSLWTTANQNIMPKENLYRTLLLKVVCQLTLQLVASCLLIEPNESNKWLVECLHWVSPTGWIAEKFQKLLAFEALASKTNA